MSLTDFQIADVTLRIPDLELITLELTNTPDVTLQISDPESISLESVSAPDVIVIAAGNVGPPGPQGKWVALTQSEYDAIGIPDPETLYVIIQ